MLDREFVLDEEARRRLGGIADALVLHDREILQRCDDSVMAMVDGAPQLIRRARGFVPQSVELPEGMNAPNMLLRCLVISRRMM